MNLRLPFRNVVSSVPDLVLGLAFLATWIDPFALGTGMHRYCVMIMLLEFITIHSSAFMGWALFAGSSNVKKIIRVIGLGIFYSLFIWAFTVEDGVWWPLWAFWLLILNRTMTVLLGEGHAGARHTVMMASWGWSVLCYILSVMISVMLPLPALGWTPEFAALQSMSGEGLWLEEPQTVFAAGFFYFTSVSIFELFADRLTAKFSDIDPKIPVFREDS